MREELAKKSLQQRWQDWIRERRALSARSPRRYATLADALARMRSANKYLTAAQAEHLTAHAASRNEDGTWSWKFDNYMHVSPPNDLPFEQLHAIWNAISCPTLLCHGENSWASNPLHDGLSQHFTHARVRSCANAGHWVHHDQLDAFMAELQQFLHE